MCRFFRSCLFMLVIVFGGGAMNSSATAFIPQTVQSNPAIPHVSQSATATVQVVLELDELPAVEVAAREHGLATQAATARAALAQIERRQQTLLAPLAARGAQVLYRVQRVYNGIAVQVAPNQLRELAALPGVKAIHALPIYRPSLTRSVPFIGAPPLWSGLNATGKHIKIGIIDTGIDYIHTDFGGSGKQSDYDRNDTAVISEKGLFPSAKVIGGYDFVGDDYDATSTYPDQLVPHPDPDPVDCYGHGTHVAGIAAGAGVTSDGKTYTGAYTSGLDLNSFKVGPGVAPQASLYALKIFGCDGSSSIITPAIEYAVDPNQDGDFSDHLDVINMSLGSSGSPGEDEQSQASNTAAKAGVIVVAAAGNDGDAFYITGGPGNAARALSVAATARDTPVVADFSSRGPSNPTSSLKPDIAAPGSGIVSADADSGQNGRTLSGTSMATPHVAGGLALLKQIHPGWTVEELKALAMNTAREVRANSSAAAPAGLSRVGSGLIDLSSAAAASVIAYSADGSGAVSVSFGSLEITRALTLTRTVTVANKGAAGVSYQLAYAPRATVPGATYSIAPSMLALDASSSRTVTVTLALEPQLMRHTHDLAVPETQFGEQRHWLSEAGGDLTLTAPGGTAPTLRLPLYAAPRPATQMHAALSTLDFNLLPAMTATITLTGQGFAEDAPPLNASSLVSALELAYQSPPITATVGRDADLRFVGAASNVRATGSLDTATLFFGIATYNDWASPHQVEIDIYIDANRDGTNDFLLTEHSRFSPSDVLVAELTNLKTNATTTLPLNGLSPARYDTALFHSNVMLLPVRATNLGLKTGASRFNYRIVTYSTARSDGEFIGDRAAYGAPIDQTPTLTYDGANPGVALSNRLSGDMPIYADLPTSGVPFAFDRASYIGNRSQGVLLLHHHNTTGQRAEIVSIIARGQLNLPLISK